MVLCLITWAIAGYSVLYLKYPEDGRMIMWTVVAFFGSYLGLAVFDCYWLGADTFMTLQNKKEER